jgi:predicted dehydrogenase
MSRTLARPAGPLVGANRSEELHAKAADTVRVGVIGFGYWGPNLVRNFHETEGATVAAVSDLRPDRLAALAQRYPTITTTTDHRDLLRDSSIEAIIVATPPSTHFQLARQALMAGKHVLVEKPMASSTAEADVLIEMAQSRGLKLMVDHTFVYTGAVQKIKELVSGADLGELYYWDSVRVNLGLFQGDATVLADLAAHDLAILDYVIDARPSAVAASGIAHVEGHPINTAYLTCFFEDNMLAHFHVNWLSPVKVRRTLIGGNKKMIVYDDIEPSEKIKVYDSGITLGDEQGRFEMLVGYRMGDMWAPRLGLTEALSIEAKHFVECIRTGLRPISDGFAGRRVVRILEAAAMSLANRGRPVELDWEKSDATNSAARP